MERGLVHVPVDAFDASESAELLERGDGREVAGVDDEIGSAQELDARVRQPPSTARQVRVSEDCDQRW
jgi:hypothetical protein